MKKKLSIIFILILIPIFAFLSLQNPKTIETAILASGRKPLKILYQDKTNNRATVFYIKNSLNPRTSDLAVAYLKKALSGWKWIDGGEYGSLSTNKKITYQYFPKLKGAPAPIIYGTINDSNINSIKIITSNSKYKNTATIVHNNYATLWYAYVNTTSKDSLSVVGLSKDGSIILNTVCNITK